MRSKDEQSKALEEGSSYRELRLLEEMDSSPDMSQRQLARRLGVALGVANVLVHQGAKKGYIRVTQLGWKRWAYFVTPKGMKRKLQLTVSYVDRFFQHYRRVRGLLREDISSLPLNRESRVALVGTGELAELAFLALREIGVDDIEVYGEGDGERSFLGMGVRELGSIEAEEFAKVVVADGKGARAMLEELRRCGVLETQLVELLGASGTEVEGARG